MFTNSAHSPQAAVPRRPASLIVEGCKLKVAGLILATFNLQLATTLAQGCIASPNNPCSHLIPGDFTNTMSLANRWVGSADYRWYESFRHFRGEVEQPQREALGNNVINDDHSFNVVATYGFNDRLSATINFPFIHAEMSTLYEQDLTYRHTMLA